MKKKIIIMTMILLLVLSVGVVFADGTDAGIVTEDEEDSSSQMTGYVKENLAGNDRYLEKFNGMSKVVQFLLTAFGIFTFYSVILHRSITVLYLSTRAQSDEIAEVKEEGISAGRGLGDKAKRAFYMCLPNIKEASDFSSRSAIKVSEDTGAIGYLSLIAIPTLIVIMATVSIYNGTTTMVFAELADASDAVVSSVETVGLANRVTLAFQSGEQMDLVMEGDSENIRDFKTDIGKDVVRVAKRAISTNNVEIIDRIIVEVEKGVNDSINITSSGTSEKVKTFEKDTNGDWVVVAEDDVVKDNYVDVVKSATFGQGDKALELISNSITDEDTGEYHIGNGNYSVNGVKDLNEDRYISTRELLTQLEPEFVRNSNPASDYLKRSGYLFTLNLSKYDDAEKSKVHVFIRNIAK